jgi:hypothetical protein
MSQYFQADCSILWNPSTAVSRVFLHVAESFTGLVGRPSGLGPVLADECEIDLRKFAGFTDSLVSQYAHSDHVILRSLMQGFLATAMAMAERGGGQLPAAQSHTEDPDIKTLQELSRRTEKAMPR